MHFINKYFSSDIKGNIYTMFSDVSSLISDNGLILFIVFVRSLTLLILGWWIINKISKVSLVFFNKACVDSGVTSFLNSILKVFLRIVLLVVVMGSLGFDVTSILAAMGASFLAVGISLKESLSNLISGIVLIINKPIHVGDFIEFESFSGRVLKIEMLFTTLQTDEEGKTVVIPNAKLVSNVVVRKSKFDILNLKLAYKFLGKTKVKDFDKYLIKEFFRNDSIFQIPAPQVNLERIKDDEIRIKINIYCQDRDSLKVKNDIFKILTKISDKYHITLETENSEESNCS